MTVKEIFELRKRGQVEAAYEAIRPIYAAHKGRYTTLCMFWVASDVFKLRVEQGRIEEAEKIYWALKRLVPLLEEYDRQGASEREATLRRAQGPQAQGTPLTVWLIIKADIVRKRDFHKDKSLFLWNFQL